LHRSREQSAESDSRKRQRRLQGAAEPPVGPDSAAVLRVWLPAARLRCRVAA
jgi:hypothetical protein